MFLYVKGSTRWAFQSLRGSRRGVTLRAPPRESAPDGGARKVTPLRLPPMIPRKDADPPGVRVCVKFDSIGESPGSSIPRSGKHAIVPILDLILSHNTLQIERI